MPQLAPTSLSDTVARAAILARHGRRWMRRAGARPFAFLSGVTRSGPTKLVIAPADIRTADPTRAEDIYAGYYVFGGRLVNGEGRSPFAITPPTPDFLRELAGFGWLRHMRASGTSLARGNARALLNDFFVAEPRLRKGPAGEPAVAARRILSMLGASPFVLHDAEAEFYRAFMRTLGRDATATARDTRDSAEHDRLLVSIALTDLALCADLGAAVLERDTDTLADELTRQIFADGGHVGRNPETLVDLLLDLLPLRHTFAARHQPVPQALVTAIDRMIPMLRLLRHGDGSLALFNGMSVTEPDHLATALAYADARGRALLNAPHAGYQRLEGADAVVIADTGEPPPRRLSREAHAGCLAFEFSLGLERIVVNCGAPLPGWPAARQAARQTAAHSTLAIDDTSSCRFATDVGVERLLRGAIIAGPRRLIIERREQGDATVLQASHDGYVRLFGTRHHRRLTLARDGRLLSGEDMLTREGGRPQRAPQRYDIRFHLHPRVSVAPGGSEGTVLLSAGRETVLFEATAGKVSVEESVLFATPTGAQRTLQIVIAGAAEPDVAIPWSFARR